MGLLRDILDPLSVILHAANTRWGRRVKSVAESAKLFAPGRDGHGTAPS